MTTIVIFNGAIEQAAIVAFCDRARVLLERAEPGPVICDVSDQTHPDAAAIEALARLQLTARRMGRRIELRGAGGGLIELLTLMGLDEALPSVVGSGLETLRQVEEREQVAGVEEEGDAGDPVA